MPWIPELASAAELARQYKSTRVPFYEGVMHAAPEDLLGSWAGEPWLDDPGLGRVTDRKGFEEWAASTQQWLIDHEAQLRPVGLTKTDTQSVEEVTLELTIGGEQRELPVGVAIDRNADGLLTAIRIYHTMWPLIEDHRVRAPILEADPDLLGPDVVGEYQQALTAGDVEGILASYEEDGSLRGPTGGSNVHRGHEGWRVAYGGSPAGGGFSAERCQVTDDGGAAGLEYNVLSWGEAEVPPQAGLAMYVRGQSGKLASVRLYDDVAPPA